MSKKYTACLRLENMTRFRMPTQRLGPTTPVAASQPNWGECWVLPPISSGHSRRVHSGTNTIIAADVLPLDDPETVARERGFETLIFDLFLGAATGNRTLTSGLEDLCEHQTPAALICPSGYAVAVTAKMDLPHHTAFW